MSEQKTTLKELVLEKRYEGKLVYLTHEGPCSIPVKDFIQQPADGILYDLNRLEEVSLTFMDDTKWVNDFAVALTIRELHAELARLQKLVEKQGKVVEAAKSLTKAWHDPDIERPEERAREDALDRAIMALDILEHEQQND